MRGQVAIVEVAEVEGAGAALGELVRGGAANTEDRVGACGFGGRAQVSRKHSERKGKGTFRILETIETGYSLTSNDGHFPGKSGAIGGPSYALRGGGAIAVGCGRQLFAQSFDTVFSDVGHDCC